MKGDDMWRTPVFLLAIPLILSPALHQQRFDEGDLKGFLVSPAEHIIVEVEKPFIVRSVEGVVLLPRGNDYPIEDVVFEIRGPGTSTKIRAATTDAKGRFRIKRVPSGTYRFKATKNGFQSVVGTLIIDKKADKSARIIVEMPMGV